MGVGRGNLVTRRITFRYSFLSLLRPRDASRANGFGDLALHRIADAEGGISAPLVVLHLPCYCDARHVAIDGNAARVVKLVPVDQLTAGGAVTDGYSFPYQRGVAINRHLPCVAVAGEVKDDRWCGYPSLGIGYAVWRDVAEAVCAASIARAKEGEE